MTATKYTFQTSGVCSQEISFSIDEKNRIHNVHFAAGEAHPARTNFLTRPFMRPPCSQKFGFKLCPPTKALERYKTL